METLDFKVMEAYCFQWLSGLSQHSCMQVAIATMTATTVNPVCLTGEEVALLNKASAEWFCNIASNGSEDACVTACINGLSPQDKRVLRRAYEFKYLGDDTTPQFKLWGFGGLTRKPIVLTEQEGEILLERAYSLIVEKHLYYYGVEPVWVCLYRLGKQLVSEAESIRMANIIGTRFI